MIDWKTVRFNGEPLTDEQIVSLKEKRNQVRDLLNEAHVISEDLGLEIQSANLVALMLLMLRK